VFCKAFGREEFLKKNERVVWQRQRQQENCGQCYPAPELCLQQDNLKDTSLHWRSLMQEQGGLQTETSSLLTWLQQQGRWHTALAIGYSTQGRVLFTL